MNTAFSLSFSRKLSLVAMAPVALGLLLIAMGTAMADTPAPAGAQRIILHHADRHPASARAARRLVSRLDAAALAVCGGGDHALAEVNNAVRHDTCWREAMKGALAQASSPFLPTALAQGGDPRP